MMTRRSGTGRRAILLAAALAAAAGFLASCSTAPKGGPVYAVRNQAVRLAAQADALYSKGAYPDALSLYRQALKSAISADYEEGIASSRNAIGKIYVVNGLLDDAAAELERARAMAERLGNKDIIALNMSLRGELALAKGDPKGALALMEAALALGPGDDARSAALHGIALACKQAGDYARAEESAAQARDINRRLKRNAEMGANLYLMSSVQLRQGKREGAEASIVAALAADREAENALGICSDYYGYAKVQLARGMNEDALWYLGKSLDIALVQNLVPEAERALAELIALETELGMTEKAAEHKRTLVGVRALAAPKTDAAPAP